MEFFERDSMLDLVCRGFTRDEVIERCGVDPGYHGNAVRRQLAGVNRVAYKVAYVRSNSTDDQLADALRRYGASELSKVELLGELGISAGTSGKLINVETLFDELGLGEAFLEIDRKRRRGDMARGMVEAHGVDNPFKLAEVQERAADTREERFGGRYTLSKGSVLAEKAHETFRERMADAEFRQLLQNRKSETSLLHFGTSHPMQASIVKERMRATKIERGIFNNDGSMSEVMRVHLSHVRLTIDDERRRGLRPPRKKPILSDEMRARMSAQMALRQAALTPEQRAEQARKRYRKMGALASATFEGLVQRFGRSGVVCEYADALRYPFCCDFYVPENDLFVEVNAIWTHGGRWYDVFDDWCVAQRARWTRKALKSKFYRVAIETWCVRDVRKRRCARGAGLNYIVLWDKRDVDDWLSLGCPDGCDWRVNRSWSKGVVVL